MPIRIACRVAGQRQPTVRVDFLVAEVDMLDEHDLAVIVFDDVVAVQTVAVGILTAPRI